MRKTKKKKNKNHLRKARIKYYSIKKGGVGSRSNSRSKRRSNILSKSALALVTAEYAKEAAEAAAARAAARAARAKMVAERNDGLLSGFAALAPIVDDVDKQLERREQDKLLRFLYS